MLSEEIDLHKIFKINPTAMALLSADFEFIDANEEFLSAIGHPLEEVIGRNAFELVPKMPADPGGNPKWTALEAALTSGRREAYQLERYDIEDPTRPGVFAERYWSAIVTPVLDQDGQVEALELSARELTPIICQFRSLEVEAERTEPSAGALPHPCATSR
jgi:PAS domain S-box-containing protein